MADINEQNLAGADKAAEALKAAAQAAEVADKAEGEACCCGCGSEDAPCACEEKACGCEGCEGGEKAEAAAESFADQAAMIEAANARAAENYDLYVRAVAEMENVRRRCAEDVQKAQKFSIEKFAQNLLPVVDSLEKAIEVATEAEGPMKDGIQATYRQLMHALEVSGMKAIDPKNEKFDPNTQQAIAMVPASEGHEAGHVAEVFQRGWLICERVLRPAMVSVVQG